MSCRRTRRLLSAYEDGELSLKQRMAVNSHVLRCDACREAMSEGERQRKTLEDAFRQPLEAPPHLAIAVLDRLEREYPVCPAPRPLAVRWGRPLVGALGSVATAVAAVWGAVQLGTLARAPLASVPKTVTPATQPQSETSAPTFASLPPVALPEELRGAGHDPLVSAEYLKHEWSRLGQPLPKPRETKADAARPTPDEPVVVASAEAPAPAPTPAGRVSTVDGVLQVARGTRWETIAADYPVEEQARMRTGEDSLVAFELNGGVVIRANADTEVVPMSIPSSPSEPWKLNLVRGELWAKVPGGGSGVEITTASGRVVANQGEVYVRAVPDSQVTQMLVLRGTALLTNDFDFDPQWATVGKEAVVRLAERPSQPTRFPNDRVRQVMWAYLPREHSRGHQQG
jgi:hypothetical protein